MEYVLLFLTVIMSSSKAILNKKVKKDTQNFYETMRFNLSSFVFAFVTVFLVGIKDFGELFNVPIFALVSIFVQRLGFPR